jgi:hypothetical protein
MTYHVISTTQISRQLSVGKITASVFWDSQGVIHIGIFSPSVTINAEYYSNLLSND